MSSCPFWMLLQCDIFILDSMKQHYLKMDGRFVEEAYEIGHIPNEESLYEYEFTKKNLAGVSEVQEVEDVTLRECILIILIDILFHL